MGMVGGYDLHLYCDHERHYKFDPRSVVSQYGGETERGCLKQARERGWVIRRNGSPKKDGNGIGNTVCPTCAQNYFKVAWDTWEDGLYPEHGQHKLSVLVEMRRAGRNQLD